MGNLPEGKLEDFPIAVAGAFGRKSQAMETINNRLKELGAAVVRPDFEVTFSAEFDDVIALRDFAMAFARKLEE